MLEVVEKRFDPDARKGLEEIGYKFFWAIQAKPLAQLIEEGEIPEKCVDSSINLRAVVPVAREIAINPTQLVVSNSDNLPMDDQLEKIEEYARGLKSKGLKHGSLESVDFNLTNASVYVQLDRGYQRRTGRPLFVPRFNEYGLFARYRLFARTPDEIAGSGRVADVGRDADDDRLYVLSCDRDGGFNEVWAVPVAEPKYKPK